MKMFDADKTRMIGLPYGEKNYDNMLNRFHPIPERYRQTDGQQWRSQRGGLGSSTPPFASKPFFHSRKVTVIKCYNACVLFVYIRS